MPGVYISYPFCAQKCSFCNFASGVHSQKLESQYVSALASEIDRYRWRWLPDTVYLGGGTPGRMSPAELQAILGRIPGFPWREATVEAAPGTLTPEGIQGWRRAGINRVSLGVQSFVARELSRTGRKHTAETVADDCDRLRAGGLDNFNIDLIAGLPWQTRETWLESLDWIQRLQPPHVSVYMFEVDEDSRLGLEVLNNGTRYSAAAVPDSDEMAEFYETAVECLGNAGIQRYEISNFAGAGRESLHNLKYWRLEPFVGFGVDAHSFDGTHRISNVDTPAEYIRRIEVQTSPERERTTANPDEERFFVGLRLSEGIELTPADLNLHGAKISRLVRDGLLQQSGLRIALTRRGVLLSNEVFAEFIELETGALP